MILACPNCKTRFKVPTGAITHVGRKVRCTNCRHVWLATTADAVRVPDDQAETAGSASEARAEMAARMAAIRREMMAPTPAPQPVATPPVEEPAPYDVDNISDDPTPPAEAMAEDQVDTPLPSDDPEPSLPEEEGDIDDTPSDMADVIGSIRAAAGEVDTRPEGEEDALARMQLRASREAREQAAARKRSVMLLFWSLLILIWVAVPVLLFGFPNLVRSAWPASERLYEMIGSANQAAQFRADAENLSTPITEEKTLLAASLDVPTVQQRSGRSALVLTGYVENQGRRAARVPRLRISLTDVNGAVVDAWDFDPPAKLITRGQQVRFEQVRSPLPQGVRQASVSVVEGQYSETEAQGRS